jgi:methyl-accepting chemotaxis protein
MLGWGRSNRRKDADSLEARLARAAFDHAPDGMLLMHEGRFIACNRACERIYGRPIAAIIGHTPLDFSAPVQADGRASAEQIIPRRDEALRSGFSRFEWLNLDPQGNPMRVLVTLMPMEIEGPDDVLVIVQTLAETAEVIDRLRGGLSALASGDLNCQIRTPFRDDYEGLRTSFNSAVESMAHSMDQVLETAHMVATGAEQIERAASDLSRRTVEQAARVESAAKALGSIGAAVRDAASSTTGANARVAETKADAEQSGAVVARTVEAMAAIETSSREISEIITVIDGIAFQTNLLALNAGVEAARAGDAGRGFAVVASEVRALAQRSADAARDIKTRIQGAGGQVADGVTLVTRTGAALGRIAEGVSQVSAMIGRVAEDTNHQARQIADVSDGVGEIDRITQNNAAMAEEASAAARGLAAEAANLMQALARFRRDRGARAVRRAA